MHMEMSYQWQNGNGNKGNGQECTKSKYEQVGMCRKDNVMESESGKAQENADIVAEYGFCFEKAQESSGYDVGFKEHGW